VAAENAAAATAADHELPSVMPCANHLKLPPYSCKMVFKECSLYAIREAR
jgi:E3 ubiquitin-protein ligase TRIP12